MKLISRILPVVLVLLPTHLGAAELRLRKSLLETQRNLALATITARVDHLGKEAHPLEEDCDLHVPLRSDDIRVPLLAEIKNACSLVPADEPWRTFWRKRISQEVGNTEVTAVGVFRIWLEHPPAGSDSVQSEADALPAYPHSNPDHQVELHPLIKIGPVDLLDNVQLIANDTEQFVGFGPTELKTKILVKKITVQTIDIDGEPYIRINGKKTAYNHWDLRARVVDTPAAAADGTMTRFDILKSGHVVPGALGIPVVAIHGSAAESKLQATNAGEIINFQALVRMHLPTILDAAESSPKSIGLPIEFVLLAIE